MRVSVLMTPYRRASQLNNTLATMINQTRQPDEVIIVEDGNDGNLTRAVCDEWAARGLPIQYFCRRDRPNLAFSNAAIPKNISIQKSTGDILILQCAEVKYLSSADIENVVRPVEEDPQVTAFAKCRGIDCPDLMVEYCQSIRRDHVMAVGGFDEIFKGYAFEDCNFQSRLKNGRGLSFIWAPDVLVEHQPHEVAQNHYQVYRADFAESRRVETEIQRGRYVANVGQPWGVLNR